MKDDAFDRTKKQKKMPCFPWTESEATEFHRSQSIGARVHEIMYFCYEQSGQSNFVIYGLESVDSSVWMKFGVRAGSSFTSFRRESWGWQERKSSDVYTNHHQFHFYEWHYDASWIEAHHLPVTYSAHLAHV